jgi:hypothetical protein
VPAPVIALAAVGASLVLDMRLFTAAGRAKKPAATVIPT